MKTAGHYSDSESVMLPLSDVADILDVPISEVRELIRSGALRAVAYSQSDIRIRCIDLDAYLKTILGE